MDGPDLRLGGGTGLSCSVIAAGSFGLCVAVGAVGVLGGPVAVAVQFLGQGRANDAEDLADAFLELGGLADRELSSSISTLTLAPREP